MDTPTRCWITGLGLVTLVLGGCALTPEPPVSAPLGWTQYTFKHAFTHEVAYGGMLQERRRALHARAVEVIERLYPERLAEHVERLAHHAFRGEAWEKAVLYLRQAGGKAMERSAYREAAAGFEQALDALRHLPESPERTEQAIDLHLDAGGVLVPTGEWAKTTDHVREAEALAEPLRDERRLGRALVLLAAIAWNWGDLDRGLELGQRALAIALGLNDVSLQTSVNYHLGMIGQIRGSYRQSAELLSRVAEALQGDRRYERLAAATSGSVGSRARLAWCLAELGEFAGAMARGEEAVRIAHEVDDSSSLVVAYRSLGLPPHRRSGEGRRVLGDRDHDVPRDGHGLLAGAGGGGADKSQVRIGEQP